MIIRANDPNHAADRKIVFGLCADPEPHLVASLSDPEKPLLPLRLHVLAQLLLTSENWHLMKRRDFTLGLQSRASHP